MGFLSGIVGGLLGGSKSSSSSSSTSTQATQTTNSSQSGDAVLLSGAGGYTKNVNETVTNNLTQTDFGSVQAGLKAATQATTDAINGNTSITAGAIAAQGQAVKDALGFGATSLDAAAKIAGQGMDLGASSLQAISGTTKDALAAVLNATSTAAGANKDALGFGVSALDANGKAVNSAFGFAASSLEAAKGANKDALGFGVTAMDALTKGNSAALSAVNTANVGALDAVKATGAQALEALTASNVATAKNYAEALGLVGNIMDKASTKNNELATAALGGVKAAYETAKDQSNNAQISDLRTMVMGVGVIAGLFILGRMFKGGN